MGAFLKINMSFTEISGEMFSNAADNDDMVYII